MKLPKKSQNQQGMQINQRTTRPATIIMAIVIGIIIGLNPISAYACTEDDQYTNCDAQWENIPHTAETFEKLASPTAEQLDSLPPAEKDKFYSNTANIGKCQDCDKTYFGDPANIGKNRASDDKYFTDKNTDLGLHPQSSSTYLQGKLNNPEVTFSLVQGMRFTDNPPRIRAADGTQLTLLAGSEPGKVPPGTKEIRYVPGEAGKSGQFIFEPRLQVSGKKMELNPDGSLTFMDGGTITDINTGDKYTIDKGANVMFTESGLVVDGEVIGSYAGISFVNFAGKLTINGGEISADNARINKGDVEIGGKFTAKISPGKNNENNEFRIDEVTLNGKGSYYSDSYGKLKTASGEGKISFDENGMWRNVQAENAKLEFGDSLKNTKDRQHYISGKFTANMDSAGKLDDIELLSKKTEYKDKLNDIGISSVDPARLKNINGVDKKKLGEFETKKIEFGLDTAQTISRIDDARKNKESTIIINVDGKIVKTQTYGKDIALSVADEKIYSLNENTNAYIGTDGEKSVVYINNEDKSASKQTFAVVSKSYTGAKNLGGGVYVEKENGEILLSLVSDKDKMTIVADKKSIQKMADLSKANNQFNIIKGDLDLELGNGAKLKINSDAGITYENADGKTTSYLSPKSVKNYFGNEVISADEAKKNLDAQIANGKKTGADVSQLVLEKEKIDFLILDNKLGQKVITKNYDAAIEDLQKFIEEHPESSLSDRAKMGMAQIYSVKASQTGAKDTTGKKEDLDTAIKIYNDLKQTSQDTELKSEISIALGSAYLQSGDSIAARNEFSEILRDGTVDEKTRSIAYQGLGSSYLSSGENPVVSLKALDHAITADPQNQNAKDLRRAIETNELGNIMSVLQRSKDATLEGYNKEVDDSWTTIFTRGVGNSVIAIGDLIESKTGLDFGNSYYDDMWKNVEFKLESLSNAQRGGIYAISLEKKGYGLDEMSKLSSREIAQIFNLPIDSEDKTKSKDASRKAAEIKTYLNDILNNPDVKKITTRTPEQLDYMQGKDYTDPTLFEKNFGQKLVEGIDLKNTALFLLPATKLTAVSKAAIGEELIGTVLSKGKDIYTAGRTVVSGAESAAESANLLRTTTAAADGLLSEGSSILTTNLISTTTTLGKVTNGAAGLISDAVIMTGVTLTTQSGVGLIDKEAGIIAGEIIGSLIPGVSSVTAGRKALENIIESETKRFVVSETEKEGAMIIGEIIEAPKNQIDSVINQFEKELPSVKITKEEWGSLARTNDGELYYFVEDQGLDLLKKDNSIMELNTRLLDQGIKGNAGNAINVAERNKFLKTLESVEGPKDGLTGLPKESTIVDTITKDIRSDLSGENTILTVATIGQGAPKAAEGATLSKGLLGEANNAGHGLGDNLLKAQKDEATTVIEDAITKFNRENPDKAINLEKVFIARTDSKDLTIITKEKIPESVFADINNGMQDAAKKITKDLNLEELVKINDYSYSISVSTKEIASDASEEIIRKEIRDGRLYTKMGTITTKESGGLTFAVEDGVVNSDLERKVLDSIKSGDLKTYSDNYVYVRLDDPSKQIITTIADLNAELKYPANMRASPDDALGKSAVAAGNEEQTIAIFNTKEIKQTINGAETTVKVKDLEGIVYGDVSNFGQFNSITGGKDLMDSFNRERARLGIDSVESIDFIANVEAGKTADAALAAMKTDLKNMQADIAKIDSNDIEGIVDALNDYKSSAKKHMDEALESVGLDKVQYDKNGNKITFSTTLAYVPANVEIKNFKNIENENLMKFADQVTTATKAADEYAKQLNPDYDFRDAIVVVKKVDGDKVFVDINMNGNTVEGVFNGLDQDSLKFGENTKFTMTSEHALVGAN